MKAERLALEDIRYLLTLPWWQLFEHTPELVRAAATRNLPVDLRQKIVAAGEDALVVLRNASNMARYIPSERLRKEFVSNKVAAMNAHIDAMKIELAIAKSKLQQ